MSPLQPVPVPTVVASGVAEEVTHGWVTKDEVTWDKVRWSGDMGGDVGGTERGHGGAGDIGGGTGKG